ncbi:MAG: RsmB/NOP family class I SAM-dependent RNA methyltransferase [Chlamydiota bacterium]
MKLPFCDHHIFAFLQSHENSLQPLDLALGDYLRAHKSIGANDRRTIGETLYGMIRWKTLIDYFCASPHFYDRLICFRKLVLEKCFYDPSIPEPIRRGLPEFLHERLLASYGPQKTEALSLVLNTPAPTTIRANLMKTTRDELLAKLQAIYPASLCTHAEAGIQFEKRVPLFSLPEFKDGLFEMQDEGSQLVASLIAVKPGEHVLDYCSGSGGKTLAFAHLMRGKGQIYLHDIRPRVLLEARKRLKRAGIQNAQMLEPAHPHLSKIKGKMDWVLGDVPCSGTGTLRRNPDSKWKIDAPMIERLVQQQREIVKEALAYVKPGGFFVYATCSILPEENVDQVNFFLKNYPLVLEKEPLALLPQEKGMDGFYAAVFRKTASLV